MSIDRAAPTRTGVFLLAYGTPETPDQVEPYFTHIRGGRPPSKESVEHLKERYEAVGGRTPLTEITEAQRAAVEAELRRRGHDVPVRVGMKHWEPWIADVLPDFQRDGVDRLACVVLAPHYSRVSVGGYQRYLFEGMEKHGITFAVDFVERWYEEPRYVDTMATLVREELAHWPALERPDVALVFSAHSLPERIRSWGDPYEKQLADSARIVAQTLGRTQWYQAWQSAGATGEPWIGPDILDYLETLAEEGVRHVLQVPIGFVCDHLEIQFDLDIEAQQKAEALGITYRRTRMPNARPDFIAAVADVCERAIRGENTVRVTEAPPSTRLQDQRPHGQGGAGARPAGAGAA